jgi:hypothetical protein
VRALYPQILIFHTDILETLSAIIPTGTWMWKNLENVPVFESLSILAARKTHLVYLNRRDTLRKKSDMQQPSRSIQYNMQCATYITGIRATCGPRMRSHQSKQLYDWTTDGVNLAKGILDMKQREIQSVCRLCNKNVAEIQIHTSTTCCHPDLLLIRELYKKEIDYEIQSFVAVKLKTSDVWIKRVIDYMILNLWKYLEWSLDKAHVE